MSIKPLARLEEVHPLPDYRLEVRLRGSDREFVVSFASMIAKGGVFTALQDKNAFEAVQIDDRHRTIFWPRPITARGDPLIDIDADALIEMAKAQP